MPMYSAKYSLFFKLAPTINYTITKIENHLIGLTNRAASVVAMAANVIPSTVGSIKMLTTVVTISIGLSEIS